MRQDIQKVICERQRGNSSERSQKTGMKVNPKFFTNNRKHKGTFEEFRARMLELSDCWDDSDIIGGVDYPNHVSSARRRQEGRCSGLPNATGLYHKRHNENTKPLYRFLTKAVGRPWNDVYSAPMLVTTSCGTWIGRLLKTSKFTTVNLYSPWSRRPLIP